MCRLTKKKLKRYFYMGRNDVNDDDKGIFIYSILFCEQFSWVLWMGLYLKNFNSILYFIYRIFHIAMNFVKQCFECVKRIRCFESADKIILQFWRIDAETRVTWLFKNNRPIKGRSLNALLLKNLSFVFHAERINWID